VGLSSYSFTKQFEKFMKADPPTWWPRYIDESAWLEHTPFAAWIMEHLNPRQVVELGTHRGVSYFAFCQAASVKSNPARCFAIDTWVGDEHAGLYGENIFEKVHGINDAQYRSFSRLMQCTFADALGEFENDSIDLLHIDGLHTYEAVLEDFSTWLPKMSNRGVMLFHDIAVKERGFGVWNLWDEITQKYPHFSFLHGYGLGVLAVGNDIPEPIKALVSLEESSAEQQYVRDCFQSLGARVSKAYTVRLNIGQRLVFPYGKIELDRPSKIPREQLLLAGAIKDWSVLEIGPSHRPGAAKKHGWKTTVIDHASKEKLIQKYENDGGVDVSQIEDVDLIWKGQDLRELVPTEMHGKFDLLIASHVIEHLPDPVGVLLAAETLLRPDTGIISLAVPDKRLCFDFFRPLSTTGKFLSAHRDGRVRHSAADLFDSRAYLATMGPEIAWGWRSTRKLQPAYPLGAAYKEFLEAGETVEQEYADCHGWTFTPASFELLILELSALGILDWRVQGIFPQNEVEFIVHLARGKAIYDSAETVQQLRSDLMKKIQMENHQQTQYYVGEFSDSPTLRVQEYLRDIWRRTAPLSVRKKVAALRQTVRSKI
jgi:SAM-dependent methyltransferase